MDTLKLYHLIFLILLYGFSCSCKTNYKAVGIHDVRQVVTDSTSYYVHGSAEYIPDRSQLYKTPERRIRVNFVFLDSEGAPKNLRGESAYRFAKELIDQANFRLRSNKQMTLPLGNRTPVLPFRYSYVLYPNPRDAVRFAQDEELYYVVKKQNQYDREVIRKYQLGMDSVLNVFIMPHHPDSMKSPTYGSLGTGIALGHAIKLNGDFINAPEAWRYAGTFNHEVGHVLGLSHTWRRDRCDDTPPHSNCWDEHSGDHCRNGYSNNMMDYNNKQEALTPCQLGIVHSNFSRSSSKQRKLLLKDWCTKDSTVIIEIIGHEKWTAEMDITSDVYIRSGARLEVYQETRFAHGCRIYVDKEGELLFGPEARFIVACHEQEAWEGIFMQEEIPQHGQNK